MHNTLDPESVSIVTGTWTAFADTKLSTTGILRKNQKNFFRKPRTGLLCSSGQIAKGRGCERHQITPYMHIMVAHINRVFFISTNQTKFSQDKGLKRTTKWLMASLYENPTNGAVLQQERSQCQLKEHEREVWPYTKYKENNWHVEIKETRKRAKVTTSEATT